MSNPASSSPKANPPAPAKNSTTLYDFEGFTFKISTSSSNFFSSFGKFSKLKRESSSDTISKISTPKVLHTSLILLFKKS